MYKWEGKEGDELVAPVKNFVPGLGWLRYFRFFQNRNVFQEDSNRAAVIKSLENGDNLMVKTLFELGMVINQIKTLTV